MFSYLVLLLLWAILQSHTLIAAAQVGDCYDDPLGNNMAYGNCATCYQTFANAIVNTGDNKYELSRMFFPVDAVPPVQVEVTYNSTSGTSNKRVWYWLMGGFYVFQPLELFLYRSLLFSPPLGRMQSLTLKLPGQCFASSDHSHDFFEYATQRVRSGAINA